VRLSYSKRALEQIDKALGYDRKSVSCRGREDRSPHVGDLMLVQINPVLVSGPGFLGPAVFSSPPIRT
jgi:hypothetical protein